MEEPLANTVWCSHGALAQSCLSLGHHGFAVRGEEMPAELPRAEALPLKGRRKCYPRGSITQGWGCSGIRHAGIQTAREEVTILNTSGCILGCALYQPMTAADFLRLSGP